MVPRPPTHDEPDRSPQTVPCSFTTFIPSYSLVEDGSGNDQRYSVLRDDSFLKQKFLNFSADCDKQITRVIMEQLPLVKIHCPDEVLPICDPKAPFILYDATAGYADRTLTAWGSGGWLDNTIHMSADQIPLNRKTKDGHQSLAEYACDGSRSNDGILSHSFFSLNGLQPCTQVKMISDFLNYHKSCTHACITLREVDDFHDSLQGYQLAMFQELPEGSVVQAGHNGYYSGKCFKYVVVRDYMVNIMMLSEMSPISPPVCKRMKMENDTDSEDDLSEEDSEDELKGTRYTPSEGGPRALDFDQYASKQSGSYQVTDNSDRRMRSVYEPWVQTASIFAQSPGDSVMAQKGSPIVEESLTEFEDFFAFGAGNDELLMECNNADAKLQQAQQTLKELEECEEESAAALLAGLKTTSKDKGKKRLLETKMAQINKQTADTEKRIKKILADRCK